MNKYSSYDNSTQRKERNQIKKKEKKKEEEKVKVVEKEYMVEVLLLSDNPRYEGQKSTIKNPKFIIFTPAIL